MRRRAGSGLDGLAGMSAMRELPGLRLVRPLLSVPKARLRALLEAEHEPFVRDPSNRDPAFARVRLRLDDGVLDTAQLDRITAELRSNAGRRVERERTLRR